MFFKPSQEKSDQYLAELRKLFNNTVNDAGDYEMLYVYDYVTKNYIIFTKNITTNYLLGYNFSKEKYVLFQIDAESEPFRAGPAEYFSKKDIVEFKKNLFGKHVLRLQNGRKYKFFIAPLVANIPGSYTIPVRQEDKALAFLDALKSVTA